MTPEALLHELNHGTEDSLLLVLANAAEKERRAAAAAVVARLERAIAPYLQMGLTRGQARRVMLQFGARERRPDARPHLALLGTGSLSEVKRYGAHVPERAFEVLAARKPAWLDAWCKWLLTMSPASWPIVRRFVRAGYCPRPESDQYYLYMLNGSSGASARELLERDPGLLEHEIWELFRREGTRDASLAHDYAGWSDALIALAAEGRLSRERLLDASLEALELPFKAHHTTWYRNFHEALAPTVEERARRLPLYLALASSTVPATVKFALKAFEVLEKAGNLPVAEFLSAAPAALNGKEKGTAAAVLRLLDRALTADPSCRDRVAEIAARALEHPAADVQAAALDLFARLGPASTETRTAVGSRLELASGRVRKRAAEWIGAPQVIEPARYAPGWTRPDPLAGEPVQAPLAGVEELVLLMMRALNQGVAAEDAERLLDGVSRLCGERPPRFDDLTSALRNQAAAVLSSGWKPQIPGVFATAFTFAEMAGAWLLGRPLTGLGAGMSLLQTALGVRPYWVAFRAKRGRPSALLATPTHAFGWIDPRTLVERVAAGTSTEPDEHVADLTQALYRLAPGHRAEALAAAHRLANAEVLRYALGDDSVRPGVSALWTAAAHARTAPVHTHAIQWEPDPWNPGLLRASLLVTPEPSQDPAHLADVFVAETQPLKPGLHPHAESNAVLRNLGITPDVAAWAALLAPGNREGWCALGAFRLANNWTLSDPAARVFLRVFDDPCLRMGQAAHLLLGLGLMAREATEADLARGGLARVIADRRLECDRLGEVLASLFSNGFVYANRLAKAFMDTARLSPRHADAVRQVLEHALAPGMPPRPADQSTLLEALLEACTVCASPPRSPHVRRHIESLKGGGKGPKLARALLAFGSSFTRRARPLAG